MTNEKVQLNSGNPALDALKDLMEQLEGIGIAIKDEDAGQWHGTEGLSFTKAWEVLNH